MSEGTRKSSRIRGRCASQLVRANSKVLLAGDAEKEVKLEAVKEEDDSDWDLSDEDEAVGGNITPAQNLKKSSLRPHAPNQRPDSSTQTKIKLEQPDMGDVSIRILPIEENDMAYSHTAVRTISVAASAVAANVDDLEEPEEDGMNDDADSAWDLYDLDEEAVAVEVKPDEVDLFDSARNVAIEIVDYFNGSRSEKDGEPSATSIAHEDDMPLTASSSNALSSAKPHTFKTRKRRKLEDFPKNSLKWKQDDIYRCQLCHERVKGAREHVLWQHLRPPLFQCPVCEYSNVHRTNVNHHIKKLGHGKHPIDNSAKFFEEIIQLQATCFPNRLMMSKGASTHARQKCKICDLEIATHNRQQHVYKRHLTDIVLFECPRCEFTSDNVKSAVEMHIRYEHKNENGMVQVISHEARFEKEITAMITQCFPGWRMIIFAREPLEARSKNNDEVNKQRDASLPMETEGDARGDEDDSDREEQESVDAPDSHEKEIIDGAVVCVSRQLDNPRLPAQITTSDGRACQLCDEETKEPRRHVIKNHLGQNLFFCPECKFGSIARSKVIRHIKRMHPTAMGNPPSDKSANYAAEIQRLQMMCFPSRLPVPLRTERAPPAKGGRNVVMECQLCNETTQARYAKRHILTVHLKQKRFTCPVCDKGDVERSGIVAHIAMKHPEAKGEPPIDNSEKLSAEIQRLQTSCFPNRAAPLVKSARNVVVVCQLCNETTKVRFSARHILNAHLKQNRFYCSKCDKGYVKKRTIMAHIAKMHPDAVGEEPIDNSEKFSAEIRRLHASCFPNRWMRGSRVTIKEDSELACRLCHEEIVNPKKHVLMKHLMKLKLFECQECHWGSNAKREVSTHITAKHSNMAEFQPIDNSEKFSSEIRQMQARCFPNRKPRRPRAPVREKQQRCRLCNVETIASNRQRHVYTHHLQNLKMFECPQCDTWDYAYDKIMTHIRVAHRAEYGKIKPISHEKEHKSEIIAINAQCFPEFRRYSLGQPLERKVKKSTNMPTSTSKSESESDSDTGSESGSEWSDVKKSTTGKIERPAQHRSFAGTEEQVRRQCAESESESDSSYASDSDSEWERAGEQKRKAEY